MSVAVWQRRSAEIACQLARAAVIVTLLIPVAAQTAMELGRPDADHGKLSYGAEADFHSAYVWRGIVLDDQPVTQPSAWISARGFTLTAWSSLALTNSSGNAGAQVTGLTLTYGRSWKKLRIELTLEAYHNRQAEEFDGPNTMEGSLLLQSS